MVRAANVRGVHRHSDDEMPIEGVNSREKRAPISTGWALESRPDAAGSRKATKLPMGLGAQFRNLGEIKTSPRRTRSASPEFSTRRVLAALEARPVKAAVAEERKQEISGSAEDDGEGLPSLNGEESNTDDSDHGDVSGSDESDGSLGKGGSDLFDSFGSVRSTAAAGHGVHPKYTTWQAFRSRISADGGVQIADQLKAMGAECAPLCSPRKLDRRRQKRAQKRIQPHLHAQARPTLSLMHPPCVVSGAVYSVIGDQYIQKYKSDLQKLYNQQLEREVNIDKFRGGEKRSRSKQNRHPRQSPNKRVTGKFSEASHDSDDDQL